ncbi:MAG: sigma factor-like helix-turn-helix DNA-binding protein [Gemmatimonadota bacterium]
MPESLRKKLQRDQRTVSCEDAELEALAASALHTSAAESGYADLFDRADVGDAVMRALGEIPEAFREAVLLVDVHDQSHYTASEVPGVPVGTVRSRLFRGRRLLQERLIDYARDAGLVAPGSSPPERRPTDERHD